MTAKAVKHRAVKHDAVRHSAVKRSAVENGAVKHSAKQEAAMKQIIQQIGPNTRLAQLTMANWKAEKTAGLVKPTAVGDAGIAKSRSSSWTTVLTSCVTTWTRTSWRN